MKNGGTDKEYRAKMESLSLATLAPDRVQNPFPLKGKRLDRC